MTLEETYPLLFYTLLAGAALGLWAVTLWTYFKMGPAPAQQRHVVRLGGWLSVALLAVAVAVSLLHLSVPLKAYLTIRGWTTSWLSREVLFTVAFLVQLLAEMLLFEQAVRAGKSLGSSWVALGVVTLVLGLGMAFSTGMIYAVTLAIPSWANSATTLLFVLQGLATGAALAIGLMYLLKGDVYQSLIRSLVPPALTLAVLAGLQAWLSFFAPGSVVAAPAWEVIVVALLIVGSVAVFGAAALRREALRSPLTLLAAVLMLVAVAWSRVWFFLHAIHV
jgi:anaerobic dimethyl sulfoxide reductase subunit C (anchor subunit)